MIAVHSIVPTLAQIAPSKRLAASFRNAGWKPDWDYIWPVLVALIAAGIAYAAWHAQRRRNDMTESTNDPWKLFRELSMVHQLDGAAWRLVRKLAVACEFEQPAQVFLVPEAFGGTATPESLAAHGDELRQLRRRLF